MDRKVLLEELKEQPFYPLNIKHPCKMVLPNCKDVLL